MIRLIVDKVCMDCGAILKYVEEWEEHYRFCTGPVRLVHTEEGIFGEVWE